MSDTGDETDGDVFMSEGVAFDEDDGAGAAVEEMQERLWDEDGDEIPVLTPIPSSK